MIPTAGQIALVIAAVICFIVGGVISLSRLWVDRASLRLASKICLYWGLLLSLGTLIWHSVARGRWVPLEDNFETLIWLAVLLAGFVMYVQRRKPLGGLDWFVMPIVTLLLIGAAISGHWQPKQFNIPNLWTWVHLASTFGGAAAFAIAGVGGIMYLVVNGRLRRKTPLNGPNLGSLERLEHLTLQSVSIGFALLTIGAITGFTQMKFEHESTPPVKLVGTLIVWLVYAVVLHAPLNPSFRGRRAAMLSVVGFTLMAGLLVGVLVFPGGGAAAR